MAKIITFETINAKLGAMNKFISKGLFESRLKIDSGKRMFFKPSSMMNNFIKSNSEEAKKHNASLTQKNISTSTVFNNQKIPIKPMMQKGKTKNRSKKQPASFNTINTELSTQKNRQTNFNKYSKCTNIVNQIKINHKKPALITININLTSVSGIVNKLSRTQDSLMQYENSCIVNRKRTNSKKNSKPSKNIEKKKEIPNKLKKMKSDCLLKGKNNQNNNYTYNSIKQFFIPNKKNNILNNNSKKNNIKKNNELKFFKGKQVKTKEKDMNHNKSNKILKNDNPKKTKSNNIKNNINNSKNIFIFNNPNSRNVYKNKPSQFYKNKQFSLQNNTLESDALKKKLTQGGFSKRQFSKKNDTKDVNKNTTEGCFINYLEENKSNNEKNDVDSENDEGMLSLDEVEDIIVYYNLENTIEQKYLFFKNDYQNFMEKNKEKLWEYFICH